VPEGEVRPQVAKELAITSFKEAHYLKGIKTWEIAYIDIQYFRDTGGTYRIAGYIEEEIPIAGKEKDKLARRINYGSALGASWLGQMILGVFYGTVNKEVTLAVVLNPPDKDESVEVSDVIIRDLLTGNVVASIGRINQEGDNKVILEKLNKIENTVNQNNSFLKYIRALLQRLFYRIK
jgi:hypothetical protein